MPGYKTKSPVLFIIFKRPDTTLKVFEKIREAQPKRLYIAADGARPGNEMERQLCEEAKRIVDMVDWDCEISTLFRTENLGCKYAVSTAVDWFFSNESEGIILEDDCLPSNDFFRFCDEMLEKFRDDTRVRHITGCNLQQGKIWGKGTYYFSRNIHVWGWAGWKRVWNEYDVELERYATDEVETLLRNVFQEPLLAESWKDIFIQLKNGKIDTWDYQLGFQNYFSHGLCVVPNYNLISNIGFREDATHTVVLTDRNANIPLAPLPETIIPPLTFLPEKDADSFILFHDFNIDRRRKALKKKRFKRWLKSIFR